MCDFPNVENNDFELEALTLIFEDWKKRIGFLPKLFKQGHKDEALILCCCYIEAIGKWLYKSELNSRETFTKTLLRYGDNEIFRRVNPKSLLELLGGQSKDAGQSDSILGKLAAAFDCFQDRFYPWEEISAACKSALSDEEFGALDKFFLMSTIAGLAYGITKCEGVHNGSFTVSNHGDLVLDFQLFHSALKRIFDKVKGLIISGKLRIY